MDYASYSSEILRVKLVGAADDWPEKYNLYWVWLEATDPVGFARRALCLACKHAADETSNLAFWNDVLHNVVNSCMDMFRQLAIEFDHFKL